MAESARARLLTALSELGRATSLRELARYAAVSPSTAHRLTAALVEEGVVTVQASATGSRVQVVASQRRRLREDYGYPEGDDAEQLDYLRSLEAELFVVEPRDLKGFHLRRKVPTFVITTKRWADALRIPAPVVLLRHPHALRREDLTPVELVVALLKLDPLAAAEAYATFSRQSDPRRYHRRRLLKRIREEALTSEALAAGIRLDARRSAASPKPVRRRVAK